MSTGAAFALVVGSSLRISLNVAMLSSFFIHMNRKSDLPFGEFYREEWTKLRTNE
jgi:hypothetical protein